MKNKIFRGTQQMKKKIIFVFEQGGGVHLAMNNRDCYRHVDDGNLSARAYPLRNEENRGLCRRTLVFRSISLPVFSLLAIPPFPRPALSSNSTLRTRVNLSRSGSISVRSFSSPFSVNRPAALIFNLSNDSITILTTRETQIYCKYWG